VLDNPFTLQGLLQAVHEEIGPPVSSSAPVPSPAEGKPA